MPNVTNRMISPRTSFDFWKRAVEQPKKTEIVDAIPVESIFELKSGAKAKLVYRNGSMVIIEVEKRRSDWIEWSEVDARIAAK
jgi:hypothetical protein